MTATWPGRVVEPEELTLPVAAQPAAGRADALLADAGCRLSGTLNVRRGLRAIAQLAVAHLADAAVVTGPPARPRTPWVRLTRGGRLEEDPAPAHDVTEAPGIAEALARYPSSSARWLDRSAAPPWLLPDGTCPNGNLLVVPMPGRALPGGALILARDADRPFTGADEALARTFAAMAGAAVSAAELYHEQAEAVRVLQAELSPPPLPHLDGIEVAGTYQPAGYGLLPGGDFYDVLAPAGRSEPTVVVLGDVCGKGARAAAVTGKVRQTLRALHLVEERPAELLRVLNQALLEPGQEEPFVTLVIGALVRTGQGNVELTVATGGHPAPLVLRQDGSVLPVPAAGTLIGVTDDIQVGTASVELAPGELCLLYSDGVTEARTHTGTEEYGEHRLRRSLATCLGMPASVALERLRQLLSDWVGGALARDDIAMLAIRAQPDGRS